MKLYDIAIIGGGPAGSQVAYRLAGMGHSVVVVEKKQRLDEPVCCTGIIGHECVTPFAISDNVIHRWVNSAKVFSPSSKLLSLRRQEPQACILDRPAFNAFLANRAQAAGAEYVLNSPVKNIEVKDDRVSIETATRSVFESKAAVIATGFGSRLAEGLGLGKASDFITGAQAEVEVNGADEVEVYLCQDIAPGFFAWLVPTSPNKALAGLLSRHSPGPHLRKLMSSLQAQGKIISTDVELRYGGIPLKPIPRSYSHRILVVGTAAGQVKPTTGGGIYYGLLCADIAANTLHCALEKEALSATSLAAYQREWKRKLGRELRIGYWARRLYELLSDKQIDRMFDYIKSQGIDQALAQADDLSFDWHGAVVLRLLKYQTLTKIAGIAKIPSILKQRGQREPGIGGTE
ncbi:MAG: NAD(P)/FAD-dependent oxidoreductase [Chloroflexi bacterium]|nr:NAD(P)/FAD-dependent oxidoreductase [Chloroflexota bacterium]